MSDQRRESQGKRGSIMFSRPVYARMHSDVDAPRRLSDFKTVEIKNVETSSTMSSAPSMEEGRVSSPEKTEKEKSQWPPRLQPKTWSLGSCLRTARRKSIGDAGTNRRERSRKICRWTIITVIVLTVFGVLAGITYISFVTTLIRRLSPQPGHSGVQRIVDSWHPPNATGGAYKYDIPFDFTRDIAPKNCHSHNDYWRRVPLYQALAAGCTGIEADVWVTDDHDLLVGHSWKSTSRNRTLRSLYLDPLTNIFESRNVSLAGPDKLEEGVFDTSPDTSLTLLIDVKGDGAKTWPVLLRQLQPLRDAGWLTHYNGTHLNRGVLTIVGSGHTPFSLVQQNSTDRFVFFDAPLNNVQSDLYNTTNSLYASAHFRDTIGTVTLHHISASQTSAMTKQINAADAKGLKSRYWSTPAFPVELRDEVWAKQMELGVGILNVDDLVGATRWRWDLCVVAGINLCGRA